MIEFNIKEKANAYDIALNKAKTLLSKCKRVSDKASMVYRAEDIENIFPELKESDDETLRKEMLQIAKESEDSFYIVLTPNKRKTLINWLEKQGKQNINILWHDISEEPEEQREIFCEWKSYTDVWHDVAFYHADTKSFWNGEHEIKDVIKWTYIDEMFKNPNPYSGTSFKYNNHTWGMCARDGGVEISIDNELKAFVSVDKSFIYPVSQSYLTPKSASQAIKEIVVDNANKVEPKFHEGDWVAINPELRFASPLYIKDIDKSNYKVELLDGNSGTPTIDYLDNHYHRWTIQDAKDGDILVSRSPFIYGKQCPYGGINWYNGEFIKASNFIFADSPVHPATKKERELLLKRMHESDYIWDADKKELKNLKEESENYKQQIMSEMTDLVKDYIQQKSAWTEEDEKKRTLLIKILEVNYPYGIFKINSSETMRTKELVSWLKSFN